MTPNPMLKQQCCKKCVCEYPKCTNNCGLCKNPSCPCHKESPVSYTHNEEETQYFIHNVSQSVEERHRCEGCGTVYAEYVNGCPRCWDDTLSREENLRKYPNRKVVPFANKYNEPVSQSVEGWEKEFDKKFFVKKRGRTDNVDSDYSYQGPDRLEVHDFLRTQIRLARADERKEVIREEFSGFNGGLSEDERKQAYEDGKNAACDFIENHCITSRHPFEHMREVNIGVINEARKDNY